MFISSERSILDISQGSEYANTAAKYLLKNY